MSQPIWKLLKNLGDVNPVDYGGYFVYIDETGVYAPEAELLISPEDDDAPEGWTVYRFSLDRCTFKNGILSDNEFHPELSAWFWNDRRHRRERPQDGCGLYEVSRTMDYPVRQIVHDLCSADPLRLALAYRAIGDYHGFENFDSYPLTFHDRAEVEQRYAEELSA